MNQNANPPTPSADKGTTATRRCKGESLLCESISLPAAVIYRSRLNNNLQWMQAFADRHGVKLAPHGKTTMTPQFFHRQRDSGAWAQTVATAPQAVAAARAGLSRIIMANQLVGRGNMITIDVLLNTHRCEFYCLVDSVDNVHQLGRFFLESGRRLNLLIEFGVEGGRCGCRSLAEATTLCDAIAQHPSLRLSGVETYEGVIGGADAPQRVREHLQWVRDCAQQLFDSGRFDTSQAIITGAGSAWYDLVAEVFGAVDTRCFIPVIRPGCYLIHDRGIYMQAQQQVRERLGERCGVAGDLQSALEVWAYVQSVPEPGLAILSLGKRDCAFDAGLPQPALHFRPGGDAPRAAPEDWQVYHIMDQHSAMKMPADADVKVGDIVALSTSHPCLTFDKWRLLTIIDDDYTIIEQVPTCF